MSSSDDAVAERLCFVLFVCVCIAAALLTHCLIDLLGDFVLAHDPYDDLAHDSRQTGAVALGLGLLATLGFGVRAALLEARGDGGALLALLRRARPHRPWRYAAAITGVTLLLVAAMEWCDAAAAGKPCDDIVDLFGGSPLLATSCAAAVAAFLTMALRAGIHRLTQLHGAIVAIVVAFIHLILSPLTPEFVSRNGRTLAVRAALLGFSTGGRAPPAFSSLVAHLRT